MLGMGGLCAFRHAIRVWVGGWVGGGGHGGRLIRLDRLCEGGRPGGRLWRAYPYLGEEEAAEAEAAASAVPGSVTWRRVLMTSKGVVRKAAAMPEAAPAPKDLSI